MFREGMYDMCLVVVVSILMYGCRSAFLPLICMGGKGGFLRSVCVCVCVCVCDCGCECVQCVCGGPRRKR